VNRHAVAVANGDVCSPTMTTCDMAAYMAADATFAFCKAYGICQIALIVAAERTSLTNLLSRVRRERASPISLCESPPLLWS
jgi:hypothetical protein